MATTIRGSLGGREKRGTSPSSSLTKKTLKSPSQPLGSSSSSSSSANKKNPSSTDGKSVPNYLKPTKSKASDTTKRSSTTDSTQKPLVNRRRSFDRPPSTSQVNKAIRSVPKTREVKPLRSTSFSHKIGTSSLAPGSTRPASTYARTTSSLKETRTEPNNASKSRIIKRGALSSSSSLGSAIMRKDKNGLKSSLFMKKAPKSVTSESSVDHDAQLIDQLVDEDDLVNIDIEVQSLPEMSEMPDTDQELGDPGIILTDVEVNSVGNVQSNVDVGEEHNLDDDQVTEDTVGNVVHEKEEIEEETVENEAEMQNVEHFGDDQNTTVEDQNATDEEQTDDVAIDDHANVTVEENNADATDEEEEQNMTVEEPNVTAEPSSDAGHVEEQNVEETVKELPEEKKAETEVEAEKVVEKIVEEKQGRKDNESATVTRAVQTNVGGRKDKQQQQAYNDVIEETATKLMGGKKNKVLALAGAFETVISLQDTNKN
ncbi:hypothetical protein RND81_10G174800 [Saponaria officinalis]|uniref:Calmodulin-binding domain-containing protein n=1 Tax=Saponaria officinalis TaxID=3572 RepID=A0AAW1I2V5_SAPOF